MDRAQGADCPWNLRKPVVLIDFRGHTTVGTPTPREWPFRPLIFGEALFDHFPDGTRALGGAPFNVAWHLRGFKADPLLVTAVGRDREGEEILERMGSWGMDTSGVQIHPHRPTGRVTAHLEGDQPHYDIRGGQAYDSVSMEGMPELDAGRRPDLLYHGTLALREDTSARTLAYLREHLPSPTLVDVNLRDPWWSSETTPARIRGSDWVKLNREELALLSGLGTETGSEVQEAAATLRRELDLVHLVVTMGEEGALASTPAGVVRQPARKVADTVDTVGAGDAFSAVLALGIQESWPMGLILGRAAEFAGEICRIRGAVPDDPRLYDRYVRRWSGAE